MQFRKVRIVIASIVFFVTACTNVSPPAASGPCDSELLSITQGAAWTYTSKGGPRGDFIYTDTIANVDGSGFVIQTEIPGEPPRTQAWSCETDGLKALQTGMNPITSLSSQNMDIQLQTVDAAGVAQPRQIAQGAKWEYTQTLRGISPIPGNEEAEAFGTFKVVMQEAGQETVTVAAGSFQTYKVQAFYTLSLFAEFQGSEVSIKECSGSSITWLAPGIGHVKSLENSDCGNSYYTATTELLSFTSP